MELKKLPRKIHYRQIDDLVLEILMTALLECVDIFMKTKLQFSVWDALDLGHILSMSGSDLL